MTARRKAKQKRWVRQATTEARQGWAPGGVQHEPGKEGAMATKKDGKVDPKRKKAYSAGQRLSDRQKKVVANGREAFRHRLLSVLAMQPGRSVNDAKEEVSVKLGFSRGAVNNWVTAGKAASTPNIRELMVLCELLSVEMADLLPTLAEMRGEDAQGNVPQRPRPEIKDGPDEATEVKGGLDGLVDQLAGQIMSKVTERVTERLMDRL